MSYTAVLALIASIVSVGYQSPIEQQNTQNVAKAAIQITNPSVDVIVAADLAAQAAQTANLSVAASASSLSISLAAKSELAQTNDNILSKPQIIQSNNERRGINDYVTASGDNVQSVADKYGISAQTIKWANNLTSDALSPGTTLVIAGTDGVVYTVKDGDTIDAIASKYSSDKQRIITYNDLEVSGLQVGKRIVLPGGTLPENERPRAAVSSGYSSASSTISTPMIAGNMYSYGYCTWYAYNRRAQLGSPVGSNWGNAISWASFARSTGYQVDNTPSVGAVLQTGGYYGLGHVAVVESVGADGSVTVSEMNYAGWNVISSRTIPAGQASSYNYIH